jgi:hypothetical protein
VRGRTIELERIHETSVVLKQLRQFTHAKAQLELYTKLDSKTSHDNGFQQTLSFSSMLLDLRQYSAMAKIIYELEAMLRLPTLSSLAIVKGQMESIKRLGSQLRSSAQEKLLTALDEQNQTTVAECLQVRNQTSQKSQF